MLYKVSLQVIFKFLFAVGICFFAYSLTLPYYKDQEAKEELDREAADKIGTTNFKEFKKYYYETIDKLKTPKTTFMDLGLGLTTASVIILSVLYANKVKTIADLKKLKSLDKKNIILLSNCIWLLLIPGTFIYYIFRSSRDDYAWFADSISIPIYEQIIGILVLLIPLNLFIFLTSIKSQFPTHLFITYPIYNAAAILKEVFWGFWLLINALCLIAFVADGDFTSIPVNLFFTYVLLSLRAGQINRINKYMQASV